MTTIIFFTAVIVSLTTGLWIGRIWNGEHYRNGYDSGYSAGVDAKEGK